MDVLYELMADPLFMHGFLAWLWGIAIGLVASAFIWGGAFVCERLREKNDLFS